MSLSSAFFTFMFIQKSSFWEICTNKSNNFFRKHCWYRRTSCCFSCFLMSADLKSMKHTSRQLYIYFFFNISLQIILENYSCSAKHLAPFRQGSACCCSCYPGLLVPRQEIWQSFYSKFLVKNLPPKYTAMLPKGYKI